MKTIKLLSILLLFIIVSCCTVRVYSDFEKTTNFEPYKTYAFNKTGIDKVTISDLDKKRILRAIDTQMQMKGFTKSENPQLVINFFTKDKERVDAFNNQVGFGWGFNPWMWSGNMNMIYTHTEGTLFIDFIDKTKNELIWQGEGIGYLPQNGDKKEERINEFVTKILAQFPPIEKVKN